MHNGCFLPAGYYIGLFAEFCFGRGERNIYGYIPPASHICYRPYSTDFPVLYDSVCSFSNEFKSYKTVSTIR